jgi:hypothetical protein
LGKPYNPVNKSAVKWGVAQLLKLGPLFGLNGFGPFVTLVVLVNDAFMVGFYPIGRNDLLVYLLLAVLRPQRLCVRNNKTDYALGRLTHSQFGLSVDGFSMSVASPYMRSFANRLILCEANGSKFATAKRPDAFDVGEKLRPQLATLMGTGCYRALFVRALALASLEVSWLRSASVKADGTLDGLAELQAAQSAEESFEGGVVLLAQVLGLLVAFIGETLTLQLLREIWPSVVFSDKELAIEAKYENAT